MNVREVSPWISVADQPTEAELQALKAQGFGAVVNLRHDGEPEQPIGTAAEGQLVERLGMAYHSFPIGGQPLPREGVAQASEFIERHARAGQKVLVHCRKGGRAAALVLLQQAREHHWPADQAMAKGQELGLTVEGNLKILVEQYLQTNPHQ